MGTGGAPLLRSGRAEVAVVDLETTGLYPRRHDRVIEIAVAVVGDAPKPTLAYSSLVNPERDIGSTSIHGLRAGDVLGAPTFRDIVGDLCELFDGRVLAAHNARFDAGFLRAEFERAGFSFPDVPWVCTMELGASLTGNRRLDACCDILGVPEYQPHSARDDAMAAAALLIASRSSPELSSKLAMLADRCRRDDFRWPRVAPSGRQLERSSTRPPRRETYVGALLARLPSIGVAGDSAAHAYLDLLERVLEDRVMTVDEAEALEEVAVEWGLSRAACLELHDRYVRALAAEAARDGIVTSAERADLVDVAAVLGMTAELLEQMLDAPLVDADPATTSRAPNPLIGASVCFTGQLSCTVGGAPITREDAERMASDHGLVVRSGVSRGLDLLVVADPDTQSGKGRRARELGTRIIVERAFWRDLGVEVD